MDIYNEFKVIAKKEHATFFRQNKAVCIYKNNNSEIEIYGCSFAFVLGKGNKIDLFDESVAYVFRDNLVFANDSSIVFSYDNSDVFLFDYSKAIAHDRSLIRKLGNRNKITKVDKTVRITKEDDSENFTDDYF